MIKQTIADMIVESVYKKKGKEGGEEKREEKCDYLSNKVNAAFTYMCHRSNPAGR